MNMITVRNKKKLSAVYPHIWDVNDLLDRIKSHGDKNLFRYFRDGNLEYMTYREFLDTVTGVAAGFDKLGLKGKRIALIGDTSPAWLASYIGALASGCVIIPMDKELAISEIDGFLRMAGAEAIVYSSHFDSDFARMKEDHPTLKTFIPTDHVDSDGGKVVSFADLVCMGAHEVTDGYVIPVVKDHEKMCEMLFTSGTTGTSKCVALCQKNIFAAVNSAVKTVCFTPDDVVLSVLPVHHTYELMCLLAEMVFGCEICINDSLRHIMKNMTLFAPTAMVLVPMIVDTMYKKIWAEAEKRGLDKKLRLGLLLSNTASKVGLDARKRMFGSVLSAFGGRLEKVICGGAKLNPKLIYGFEQLGIAVYQGFGITECAPLTAVEPYYARRPGSIGPAVPCCRMRIDPNGEKTPEGYDIGEVQVRGENVMIGYYGNPEANEEVFTSDGWFRTGDIGYADSDGYFYITGRIKFVIVSENGKNVFPEEIEEYLGSIEEIKECVVIGRKSKDGDKVNLTAIVYPDYTKFEDGASDSDILAVIREKVGEINKNLPTFKRVKTVELRKTEFEKTTTKKIKRQLVK